MHIFPKSRFVYVRVLMPASRQKSFTLTPSASRSAVINSPRGL